MTDIDIKEFMYLSFKNMDEKIKEIAVGLKENSEMTEKILLQATKTNGRVNALEDKTSDYSAIKSKVWWIIGVGATFMVLGSLIYVFVMGSISAKIDEKFRECCESQKKN